MKPSEYQKLWASLPENHIKIMAYKKRWRDKPESKIKMKEYLARPEIRKITKERSKRYRQTPQFKKVLSEYLARPEVKISKNNSRRNFDLKVKKTIMNYYGKICQCCGESNLVFLSLDHINGGGTKHRKEIGIGKLYRWIVKNNFPSGFQVLCMNCNWAKSHGGCPHLQLIPIRLRDNKFRGR